MCESSESRIFLTRSKPSRSSINAKKKKKKERRKKKLRAHPSINAVKRDAGGKKACNVANAFLSRLELIWPIFSPRTSKMSKKNCFWQKAQSQWYLNQTSSNPKPFLHRKSLLGGDYEEVKVSVGRDF